jgi:hypothetical protein
MKTRLVVPLVGLAISFALPSFAQQKDVADPQTTQKVRASFKGFDEAINNSDAAAIAAYYTLDAVFVTTGGPIIGRQAIQRWYADMLQRLRPKNRTGKLDGNNVTPDSVILTSRSFPPQPAATPSPIASPGTQ